MSKIEYNDLIGKKYGHLTVVNVEKNSAVCKCSCGNMKTFPIYQLEKGRRITCGECYKGISRESFVGKKYGHLTVVNVEKNSAVCKCSCGNMKTIKIYELEYGKLKTCGQCYNGVSYESFVGKKYGHLTVVNMEKNIAVCKCDCGNTRKIELRFVAQNENKTCGQCYNGVSYESFVGKKYGTFKILNIKKVGKRNMLVCKCDCGIIKEVQMDKVKKGKIECGNCHNGIPYKNYIGKTFGYLTITNFHSETNGKYFSCTCQCGKETKQPFHSLVYTKVLSCGCFKKKIGALKKISFGSLNIVGTSNYKIGGLRYVCRCTCGNEIEVLESDLFTGKVTCCEECKK